MPNLLKNLHLEELSLVDRPANAQAMVSLFKRDNTDEETTKMNEEEMEAQIEIEADNLIPYSLDEVSIDFETLSPNVTDPSKVDVLLSACRTENIDARVDALDAVELDVKVVDVEGYALGRSADLIYGQLPDGAKDKIKPS